MDIPKLEKALNELRRRGGFKAEFDALQGVVSSLAIRQHIIGDGLNLDFYVWYLERLMKLDADIVMQRQKVGPPYQLQKDDDYALLLRIRVIISVHPEITVKADN